MERHKSFSQFSKQGGSISTFMSELRALAEFCNFGTSLDIMLCDRLVCGVNDSHIQCCLLSEPVIILQIAMQKALGMESEVQNARNLQGRGKASAATLGEVFKFTRAKQGSIKQQMLSCTRIGKLNHHPSKMQVQGC